MSTVESELVTIQDGVVSSVRQNRWLKNNVPELVLNGLEQAGNRTILVNCETGCQWRASEIRDEVLKLGKDFLEFGLELGDVVCFYCKDSDLHAISLLAVLSAGGVYCGAAPRFVYREVLYICQASNAKYIIANSTTLEVAQQVAENCDSIQSIIIIGPHDPSIEFPAIFALPKNRVLKEPEPILSEQCSNIPLPKVPLIPVKLDSERDGAMIAFSSGSTGGELKAVLKNHRSMAAFMSVTTSSFEFGSRGSRILTSGQFHHPTKMAMLLNCLSVGTFVALFTADDSEHFLSYCDLHRITSAFIVPSAMVRIVKARELPELDLHCLRDIIITGAPLPLDIGRRFMAMFKLDSLRQSYGSIELGWLTLTPLGGSKVLPSSGVPLSGSSYKIKCRLTGEICGPGHIGEIYAKSPMLPPGPYLNNDEANSAALDEEGYFATGDAAYYDKNGNLFVTDRYKDVIKCDGVQVSPSELESIIDSHPDVQEAAVIGIKCDWSHNELAKAYVVRNEGATLSQLDLIDYVGKQVAPFKQLRGGVEFVESFERTELGEINRQLLKAKHSAG